MALRHAAANNGYLPQATGQVVAFIRKEDEFKLNKYVQYVPSKTPVGIYSRIDRDNAVRTKNPDQNRWADGDDAPKGDTFKSRFTTEEFRCERYSQPWNLGAVAVDNATLWKPKLVHMAEAVSVLMSLRTKRVITKLETPGNWGGNTATATALGGAKFDAGTAAAPSFAKGLLAAAQAINLATNAKVKITDLRCVLSPLAARKISVSAEFRDYLKGSPHARMMIENPFENVNALWGLPPTYQGVELVVEDAPNVTEYALADGTEATTNRLYIKDEDSAVLVARPGGLDGEYGAPSFSTVQVFHYEALMNVKQEFDSWNEKHKGMVYEWTAEKVAAPVSGYLITDIIT